MAALAKPQATTFPLAERAAQRPRPVTCPFPHLTVPLSLAASCRRTCFGAGCVHICQRWTWASLGAAFDRPRDHCLSSARGERSQGCALTDACKPESSSGFPETMAAGAALREGAAQWCQQHHADAPRSDSLNCALDVRESLMFARCVRMVATSLLIHAACSLRMVATSLLIDDIWSTRRPLVNATTFAVCSRGPWWWPCFDWGW